MAGFWEIIKYPHLVEKSINLVEKENKLVLIINRRYNKKEIKKAVEDEFKVKVLSVRVQNTPKGVKKAYIKLSSEHSASEIASRLGMV
ncbi:MAG: 50S ribosomal protein L23 [Candidatus Aenigmatarchaeota archaeon]